MRTTAKVIASSAKATLDLIMRKSVWRKDRCSCAATTLPPWGSRVVIAEILCLRKGRLVSSESEQLYGRLSLAITRERGINTAQTAIFFLLYASIVRRMRRRLSHVANNLFFEEVSREFFVFFQTWNFWEKELCLGILICNINPLFMSVTHWYNHGNTHHGMMRMDLWCVQKILSPNPLTLNEVVYLVSFLDCLISGNGRKNKLKC